MGNNKRKTQGGVRSTVDQLARPSPKMNLKGRLNENVTNVTGNEYNEPAQVPAGFTVGYGDVILAPGNSAGRANAAVQGVGRFFQKGLFLPGTFVKYIPSVGLNTAGNVIMGYIDNPDTIRAWNALGAGNHLNFIRDLNNSKTGPVWQELTFPLTQAPRRKIFMIDPIIDQTIDAIDQSVQGVIVWAVYGVASAATTTPYGQLLIHCKNRFEEVKSFQTPQPS